MRTLFVALVGVALLSACGAADPNFDKAAGLALSVPLSANSPQGKTLGECMKAGGYGTKRSDLVDSVQPRPLEDGGKVYRVTFYDDDAEPLNVGVVLKEQAVGGWKPEDAAELESLGCFIEGSSSLDLS